MKYLNVPIPKRNNKTKNDRVTIINGDQKTILPD